MVECCYCRGNAYSIGILGSLECFQCRNCGIQFSLGVDEMPYNDIGNWEDWEDEDDDFLYNDEFDEFWDDYDDYYDNDDHEVGWPDDAELGYDPYQDLR